MLTSWHPDERIHGEKVILREKRLADALNDYSWGIDKELMRLDATEPIKISFSEFLLIHAEELGHRSKKHRRLAIETSGGKHIGNCTYYNIDHLRKETELGIMIGNREYWGRGYGSDAILALTDHIFNEIGLERVYLRTLDTNIRAQRCFEKCGFVVYGRVVKQGLHFFTMELCRQ